MYSYKALQEKVESTIQDLTLKKTPKELYEPVSYVLGLGGKRIRPVLALMSTELFNGKVEEAMYPAVGLELFHNFTLIHDDIMDQAQIRRGKPTVHEKWNVNNAILSGDLLQVIANQYMAEVSDDILREVLVLYNDTAIKVCEGQQLDMNYEREDGLNLEDYINMISLKTAALLATSLRLGAVMGRTSRKNKDLVRDFGLNLGIAFQIQDDMLDTFGLSENFGKNIGGDILAGKQTYLYLKAMEVADDDQKELLNSLINDPEIDDQKKVKKVKELYTFLGIQKKADAARERYYQDALLKAYQLDVPDKQKKPLLDLAEFLMQRRQ